MTLLFDLQLARRFDALDSKPIDDTNALPLLAAIADTWRERDEHEILEKLRQAPSREAQLALVKDGLSGLERRDVRTLLAKAEMAPQWRAFFEALLEEKASDDTPVEVPVFRVDANMANGITGSAPQGVTIEAINLSTAPAGRLHTDDTVEIARAGKNGKFNGGLVGHLQGTQDGDIVRLRTRDAAGKTSDWLTLRASGLGAGDTRNAVVALLRIGLHPSADGFVEVSNINESRQISEPGAELQLTNQRTGVSIRVKLDDQGTFPAGVRLAAEPGDTLAVAASDGTNNLAFTQSVGTLTVPQTAPPSSAGDLPDPGLHHDELDASGKPRFQTARFTGPLFVNEPSPLDVRQGQIGDCYFPSAVASICKTNPKAIKDAIEDNSDGTYTVTFHEQDFRTRSMRAVKVHIDADLYVRSSGTPLYGATTGQNATSTMELWFPLLEKAWAQYKGGYEKIGNGGSAGAVFTALLGRLPSFTFVSPGQEDTLWNQIKGAMDGGLPAALGTSDDEQKFKNTGIYGDHSYSVLGYKEEKGKRYVQIRNPWAESEPVGNGEDDGVFFMEIGRVCQLYSSLDTVMA